MLVFLQNHKNPENGEKTPKKTNVFWVLFAIFGEGCSAVCLRFRVGFILCIPLSTFIFKNKFVHYIEFMFNISCFEDKTHPYTMYLYFWCRLRHFPRVNKQGHYPRSVLRVYIVPSSNFKYCGLLVGGSPQKARRELKTKTRITV